jgi:hypothetical protein
VGEHSGAGGQVGQLWAAAAKPGSAIEGIETDSWGRAEEALRMAGIVGYLQ